MRTVKELHKALYAPMGDLLTYTALPYRNDFERFDPFLVLNHHGMQHYRPNNNGLPFGPHPHRGMETLTLIYSGDIMHRDSTGSESVIKAGGIQWMTAGRGIIHEEISSQEFKEKGGTVEVIQLWFNLPRALKMSPPRYIGLQKEQIPYIAIDGKVTIEAIAGNWQGQQGAIQPANPITIASLSLKAGGKYSAAIPGDNTVLLYVVNGEITVNGKQANLHTLVEFDNDGEQVDIEAAEGSTVILGYGSPTHEPIVAYGPFVMNSEEEIQQAYADYRAGLFK